MRTSVVFVAAFALAGIVACSPSRSAEEAAADDLERSESLRSELASANANRASGAVVSDLEVPPIAQLEGSRRGDTPDPRDNALGSPAKSGVSTVTEVDAAKDDANTSVRAEIEVLPALTAAVNTMATTTSPVAVPDLPDLPFPRPEPALPTASEGTGERARTSGDGDVADEAPETTRRNGGIRVGGSIIRGGGSDYDDCRVHGPGMIPNNRIPVGAGVGHGSHGGTVARPQGGTMINSRLPMRGAGTFPAGGIR